MLNPSASASPCPACGFAVFARPYGSLETCPVCRWVDDLLQFAQPDFAVGGNPGLSLRQAQARILAVYPASVQEFGGFARDSRWRPLDPGEYPISGPFTMSSPVCYMSVPDPDVFEPYWLRPGSGSAG